MALTHLIPADFRINEDSDKDLERKIKSLSKEKEVEIFLHPRIGRGHLGEADYSNAITTVLEEARSYALEIAGGKIREASMELLLELIEKASPWYTQLYLAALSIQAMEKRDDLTFREGPVKVFLYRDYDHPLGTYVRHNTSKRMVAEIEYVPFGSKETKAIEATGVGYIRIRRENVN